MLGEGLPWKDGSHPSIIAGSRLGGEHSWSPTEDALKQDTPVDPFSHGNHYGVETARGDPLADYEYAGVVRKNITVVTMIVFLLALFQFTPPHKLSNFYARKLTHITMGACLLVCQPIGHLYMKVTILAVGISAILTCFVMPLRFSERADRGIILYNVIVCMWVLFDLPLTALGPMFCADPCGAIAGKLVRSPRWIGNKTVAGSVAVFTATFLTAFSAASWTHRLILSAVCCLLEAVGGRYDNAFVAVPLIVYYFGSQNQPIR